MNKRAAALLLDELYKERQKINESIYHIRRYVLRLNYKRTNLLIAEAKKFTR